MSDLQEMQKNINAMFAQTTLVLDHPDLERLNKARSIEDAIDKQRTDMVNAHLKRLERGECKPQSSNVFINLVGNLERCGDHLNFIAERSCSDLNKGDVNSNISLHP